MTVERDLRSTGGFYKRRLPLWIAFCCVALCLAAFPAYAAQQEYAGEIPFKDSEKVQIRFYLSGDRKKVEKINFKMDALRLNPEKKDSGVSHVTLQGAELNDTTGYKITDGKLRVDSFFVFDLTVIDSCIYGKIGIRYETDQGMMVADPVYAVIPNKTNPKAIPQKILKP